MIKYKCPSCGAKLETEDSLSGKHETCPACRKSNPVPLSKSDQAEQRQKEKIEEKPQHDVEVRLAARPQQTGRPGQQGRRKPTQTSASATEGILRIFGFACVIIGIVGMVIYLVIFHNEGEAAFLTYAMASALIGLLVGMPCFVCQEGLQYLRRIMNAVEGAKDSP